MDVPVIITRMRRRDIPAILEIGDEGGLSSWSREAYCAELKRTDSIQLVARSNKETIGFIIMRLIKFSSEAEIHNLAVKSAYRKKGTGSKLIQSAIQLCNSKNIWLEVRESNVTAIRFYQNRGFTIAGLRKSFYTDPTENAFIMNYRNTANAPL